MHFLEPTLVDFRRIFQEKVELISRSLVVTDTIRRKLKLAGNPTNKLIADIDRKDTPDSRVGKLLDNLTELADQDEAESAFESFVSALCDDGQEHVANIFRPQSHGPHPMSDEHYELLVTRKSEVCKFLDPSNALLDELDNDGVFKQGESRQVKENMSSVDDMAREIIDILSHKADSAFDLFITALQKTGQEHVATILRPDSSQIPMSEEHRDVLTKNLANISKFLDPDCGVRVRLLSSGAFSRYDDQRVKSKIDYGAKTEEIVNILLRKADSVFEQFIEILDVTGQQHVVYLLTRGSEQPLSELRWTILRNERHNLKEMIEPDHLIDKLFADHVLNETDRHRIMSQPTVYLKNSKLLDAIARNSQSAYDRFLQALKDVGQEHIATQLEGLEVRGLVATHFRNDTDTSVRNKIIKLVKQRIETLIRCEEHEVNDLIILMEQNGFTVSSVSEGSILIIIQMFQ